MNSVDAIGIVVDFIEKYDFAISEDPQSIYLKLGC